MIGKLLASSGSDKTVIVWDVASSKMQQQFNGHSDDVNSVTFSPNGKYLASGGNDKKIILWDLTTGKVKNTFSGNLNSIKTLAFINNGEVIVSGENDSKVSCKINFWETESGKKIASERSDCSFTNFSFSPDEKLVAIAEKKVAIKQRVATTTLQDEPDINGPLEFSEVALVQNVKAEELFKRAKEWLVTTLLTSNEVLQVVDKENGILIGKGSIIYKPDTFMGKATLTGSIRFIIKILVKDGKYKYTFTDFTHTGTSVTVKNIWHGANEPYQLSYGLLTNSEKAPDGMEYRTSVWEHMKEVSSETARNMIDSLTAHMQKSVKSNNDW